MTNDDAWSVSVYEMMEIVYYSFFFFIFFYFFFFLSVRRPPRSTQSRSSAASDVYKRQTGEFVRSFFILKFSLPRARPAAVSSGYGSTVSYTHLPSPRDRTRSRMPSSAWKNKKQFIHKHQTHQCHCHVLQYTTPVSTSLSHTHQHTIISIDHK